MKDAFYCNQPCQILSELPNGKVVIELVISVDMYEGGYDEPPYSEPEYSTIIVDKKYISEKKIKLEEVFREKQLALEENRKLQEKWLQLRKDEIENQIKDLNKQLLNRVKKYKGLEEYLNYLDGVYKYIVYLDEYRRYMIYDINKVVCEAYKPELSAVIFRSQKAKERYDWEDTIMLMGQYRDGSGGSNAVKGFATIEEALVFIKEKLDKAEDNKVSYFDDICKEHNISHPKLDKYREEIRKKRELESQKEIQELERKLKLAKGLK